MPNRLSMLFRVTALAAALVLPACSGGAEETDLASLDNQIVGNDADPALTSALEDQILVDPTLANQSNRNAVRPPETPAQAQYPVTRQEGAARTQAASPPARQGSQAAPAAPGAQPGPARRTAPVRRAAGATGSQHDVLARAANGEGGNACGGTAPFDYNPGWANRLSSAFAVYPGSRITDAAGNDSGDCRVRVVTFTTGDAPQRVLDWYRARADRAGYSAEHQVRGADHVLGGANERDGGAFYLIVTPLRSGGSDVALIANNGR